MSETKSVNDKWFQHEGLDRTSSILIMLDQLLGYEEAHPSIWNDECKDLLKQATSNLAELYQKIGEWEE